MSPYDLAVKLFLQLAVILIACRLVGAIARRLGQTQVVGEMIAGVLLGPSLLGLLAPGFQEWLFPGAGSPHPSMAILFALSHLGLVLYMFLVGLEFDGGLLRRGLGSAGSISAAGILAPFALGAVTALLLSRAPGFFGPEVASGTAALYLGASMSITAFPMLARILAERGLAGSRLGTLALAAGAIDDATAWCLLALVLASLEGSAWIALLALGGGAIYAVAMFVPGRRWLARLGDRAEREGGVGPGLLLTALIVLMGGAWFTDMVGIYAVFGAFVAGCAMPRGAFARGVRGHLELVTITLLLPIFFVYSGLNTRIGLVDSLALWAITLGIVALAIVGKGVACALAARRAGESWRDAASLGTLMNARGLMELIILNIGLQAGIITPTLFSIMVLMAVVTTLMTSPLFTLLQRARGRYNDSLPMTTPPARG